MKLQHYSAIPLKNISYSLKSIKTFPLTAMIVSGFILMYNANGKRSNMHAENNKPISLLGRMLNKNSLSNKISCHGELY